MLRNEKLRRLPGNTSALLGVVPTRGEVVPAADLGALLGLSAPSLTRPLVVVLDDERAPVGLLVDTVTEVSSWRRADLRTLTHAGPAVGEDGPGVGPGHTVVLDVDTLLADLRLSTLVPTVRVVSQSKTEEEPDR